MENKTGSAAERGRKIGRVYLSCAECVVLSWRARNHLTSVMEAGCGVKLGTVANGPVITQLYIRCAAFTQRLQNRAGRQPKIETPN